MIGETKFHATARFENGKVTLSIVAVTPYGDRSVSTTKDVTDKKVLAALGDVFKDAIDAAGEYLKRDSFNHAARAVTTAFDRGEDLVEQLPHVRVENYDELQKDRAAKAKEIQGEVAKTRKEK
jgi:hypothetical protein